MLRISELRNKDVINIQDGKRIGYIDDIELDLEQGRIESLLIPAGGGRMFRIFDKGEERVIHWRQIKKIGVDVILIDPDAEFSVSFGRKDPPLPEQPLSPPRNPFEGDPFAEQEGIFEL